MGKIISGIFITVVGGLIVAYLSGIIFTGGNNGGYHLPAPTPPVIVGGDITVTTTTNPPVLSKGEQAEVRVYVQDNQGRPLPHAMVTLASGGGQFNRTGTSTVSGPSDSSGSFVGYWSCDPCAPAYVSRVRVTKQDFNEANAKWRVKIR